MLWNTWIGIIHCANILWRATLVKRPALVKIGLILARIFHFNGLLVCKGLTARVSSRPGAKAACQRPRPAGTRQYNFGFWFQFTLRRNSSPHCISSSQWAFSCFYTARLLVQNKMYSGVSCFFWECWSWVDGSSKMSKHFSPVFWNSPINIKEYEKYLLNCWSTTAGDKSCCDWDEPWTNRQQSLHYVHCFLSFKNHSLDTHFLLKERNVDW